MKLRGRISFHFLIQFIVLFVTTFLIIIGLLVLLVNVMADEELAINPHKAIVENLPISTIISDDHVELSKKWVDVLKKNNTWLQIINQDGKVIHASNTPDSLQDAYSINDLLKIEETGKYDQYTVDTHYETWDPKSYYFLFGYINEGEALINQWHDNYSDKGMIDESLLPEFEQELEKHDGKVEIYEDGKLIQEAGRPNENHTKKLDIMAQIHAPGKQKTETSIYHDRQTDIDWVFYAPNKEKSHGGKGLFLSKELQIIFLSLAISLGIAIAFSIWNGYRYGKPLLLFINWLDVIKNKQYDNILSKKEQKRIYRKNGKIKLGYRLYKEVIESFSKMAQQLAAAEKDREQLEKTREEWMSGISHDLRTPISSIQGYGHMLESNKYDFSQNELQGIGKVIREKSDYMVGLVEDFSLVFKLKNSSVAIDKTVVDMNRFIKKVLAKFQNDLTLKDYTFHFESGDESHNAAIDPKWFVRVLDNLIYNAVKHNPINTTITIRLKQERENLRIDIVDDGIGMDDEFLNNLFDRYYRGTSTQERSEGEGLGMSIAKAIIELHEGDISVQSKKDVGTTVTILLSE